MCPVLAGFGMGELLQQLTVQTRLNPCRYWHGYELGLGRNAARNADAAVGSLLSCFHVTMSSASRVTKTGGGLFNYDRVCVVVVVVGGGVRPGGRRPIRSLFLSGPVLCLCTCCCTGRSRRRLAVALDPLPTPSPAPLCSIAARARSCSCIARWHALSRLTPIPPSVSPIHPLPIPDVPLFYFLYTAPACPLTCACPSLSHRHNTHTP